MMFELGVSHIYQRTFDTEALLKALSSSHWYIISRCERVRIVEGSVRIEDDIVSLKVSVQRGIDELIIEPLVMDVRPAGAVTAFESHRDGSYFTMVIGAQVIHGDAWALASLFTHARPDIARQEVLYVGHSFAEGRRDAGRRTTHHQPLQRIYEDHGGSVYDIFVAPLHLANRSWSSDDHIEDDDEGPDSIQFYADFAEPNGPIKKRAVDLIEHALIAYFDPPYNQKLRRWDGSNPTQAMRIMRTAGFRLLAVHLNAGTALARFCSSLVTDPIRSHLILHDLPPEPARPQLRGVCADNLSWWRPQAAMVRRGPGLFAGLGEYGGVELRFFGDQAPADRRPPGVPLPAVDSTAERISTKVPRTKAADRAIGKKRRHLQELRKLREPSARPTYRNGAIDLGTRTDGEAARWYLYNPDKRVAEHGFVLGAEMGRRAAVLRGIAREALRSRQFIVVLNGAELDTPRREGNWWDFRPTVTAVNIQSSHEALKNACDALDQRAADEARRHRRLPRRQQNMLTVIADTDEILSETESVARLRHVLECGGKYKVALALGINDIDAAARVVGEVLLHGRNQWSIGMEGPAQVGGAKTSLRSRRTTTVGEPGTVTFLLTLQVTFFTVSELIEVFPPELSFAEVAALATVRVLGAGTWEGLDWEQSEPAELWSMLDPFEVRTWTLRKHVDGWVLARAVFGSSGVPVSERSERIAWAERALRSNFALPSQLNHWQVGPTFAGADTETLYCSVSASDVTPLPRSNVVWSLGKSS